MAKALVVPNDESTPKSSTKLTAPAPGQVAERFTGGLEKMRGFFSDVRGEMRKIVTPTMKEVQATTTVVIVTVFAFAAYFYVVDTILGRGIQAILHWLGASQS